MTLKHLAGFFAAAGLAIALVGCGDEAKKPASVADGGNAAQTLKVGVSPVPGGDLMKEIAPVLAKEGIRLESIEFSDYIQPNLALADGSLDANLFQHKPYMDDFNVGHDTHLVSVAAIHYEPFGIYAGKTASLDALADGATISVPNDGTNEARALMLLEAQGLITLKEDAGFDATVLDIAENPKNLNIVEMEAAQLTISLPDVDLAVINGNYALQAGLNASTDALVTEDPNSDAAQTYANIVAVKEGNENDERIQKLVAALQSDEVRDFITNTYSGAVLPVF